MGKLIHAVTLSDTLSLSECTDGFWLWDKTRQMNLAVKSKSDTAALVEALTYYQQRFTNIEREHAILQEKVSAFVSQFADDSEE